MSFANTNSKLENDKMEKRKAWTNKDGSKSDYYECPKCYYKHYDMSKMQTMVLSKFKSLPVHMFCPCGYDLGKFS